MAMKAIFERVTRDSFDHLRKIATQYPLLTAEQEYRLACNLRDNNDHDAAATLIMSHLRLVIKISQSYRGYGFSLNDLVSEGCIGMIQAVKRFDPDKGFRLSTYSMWWIRAAIQEYILHNWSLVKIGTTAAQKKLFYNLRRAKRNLALLDESELTEEQRQKIADMLQVSEDDVASMNQRLSGTDRSLNAHTNYDGEAEWQDMLIGEDDSPETMLSGHEQTLARRALLEKALTTLNERSRHIVTARRLAEQPTTLSVLAQTYQISRERVRQIEFRAIEKLQQVLKRDLETERFRDLRKF